MEIRTTPVSKCLDKKLKVFGFEVMDLLALFLTISILNFIFGKTDLKLVLVWMPSLALAATLYFSKRGKPENYLIHWLRFQYFASFYSAFDETQDWKAPPTIQKKGLK